MELDNLFSTGNKRQQNTENADRVHNSWVHCVWYNIAGSLHDDVIKWKHFRVTGPLWGESTGDRRIPLTKASDAELWCFLWSAPEETVEITIEPPVIWDAIALIIASL